MRLHPAHIIIAGLATSLVAGALTPTRADETTTLATPAQVAAEVDRLMAEGWRAAKVEPRPLASDAEWLRRASLDTTGVIADEEVVRAFLASDAPDKRARAIESMLASDGYARSMGLRWAYLLVGREFLLKSMQYRQAEMMMERRQERMNGGAMEGDDDTGYDGPVPPLVGWLEEKLGANVPFDQVVRELISATGSANENPAVHYVLKHARGNQEAAAELAGHSMRVFQGLQIQCAQCHDHPYTAWKQQDFYGIAAFFSRAQARRLPPPEGSDKKNGPYEVRDRNEGQIRIPAPPGETGRLVLPRFHSGEVIRPGAGVDRRAELARLITSTSNPLFARAVVNRIWSFYFARGIVSPVDDLETKEYPHPQVLALLERDFRQSGHDLRRLCQVILLTHAYQLTSSGPEEGRDAQLALFARAPLRTMSAEQLFYSVLGATGAEDVRSRDAGQRRRVERMKANLLKKFLTTFGDDEGQEVVEEGTIPQALMLLNGPLTNDAVRPRPGHPLYERLFRMRSADERIETIYLRTLGRMPEPAERGALRELLASDEARTAAGQAQAYADIYWALLNSAEFGFNH
jgi:hypothetical protein